MFPACGSYVNVCSLGERQHYQVFWYVRTKILCRADWQERAFIVPTERGPQFCSGPPYGSKSAVGSAVPKCEWLIYSYPHCTLRWILPEELLGLQGMSIADFWGPGVTAETLADDGWTYWHIAEIAGESFHMRTVGTWLLSSLLLKRATFLGDITSYGDPNTCARLHTHHLFEHCRCHFFITIATDCH